jgi:hypothetical protein
MQVDESGGISRPRQAPPPCFAPDSAAPTASAGASVEEGPQGVDMARGTPLPPVESAAFSIAGDQEEPLPTPEHNTAVGDAEVEVVVMGEEGGGVSADPHARLPTEYEFHVAASQLAAAEGVGHLQDLAPVMSVEGSSGARVAVRAPPPITSEESGAVNLLSPSALGEARVGSGEHKSFWGRLGLGPPRSSTLITAGIAVVGLGVAALAVGGALRGAKPRFR